MKVIEGEDGIYGLVVNQDELDFIVSAAGQTSNGYVPFSLSMYKAGERHRKAAYFIEDGHSCVEWKRNEL